jgi:branched-chain amino acid transport system substrate-binding protein
LIVALSVAACGGGSEGGGGEGGGESVKIGSLHPLTGALANDGSQMDEAVKMAVEDINSEGGIEALDGAQLEVVSGDTQGEPEVAQSEAQRITGEGVAAMIGTYQSSATSNVARVAERSQVPLVMDVTTADEILEQDYKYTFRLQPNATSMGTYGARYLKEISEASGEPVETVVYMHEQTDFGQSVFEAFASEAENQGIEVLQEIKYDAFNTSDLTSQLSQVKSKKPDVLVATGYYTDSLLLAKNAAAVKPEVKAVYGVANGAFDLPQFPSDAGENGESYLSANYHFDATDEKVQELRDRFRERTDEEMRTPAVFSYQSVQLIADALGRAGSSEPQALRDAIAETSIEDSLFPYPGPIEFDESGENVNAQPVVMQVQDGKVLQVYPEDFAQAEPKFPAVPWGEAR